jgi:hypothetical protein
VGIDTENGLLPFAHPPDVRLVHAGFEMHVRQVLRDLEQPRSLQARRDGLAGVDLPVDHHAANRRSDDGSLEINLGDTHGRPPLLHLALRDRDLCLGYAHLGARCADSGARLDECQLVGLEPFLRCSPCLCERLGSRQRALRIGHRALCCRHLRAGPLEGRFLHPHGGIGHGQIGAGLLEAGPVGGRIDPREDLAFLDRCIEISLQFDDLARNLAADLHRYDRLQRARREHGALNRPTCHRPQLPRNVLRSSHLRGRENGRCPIREFGPPILEQRRSPRRYGRGGRDQPSAGVPPRASSKRAYGDEDQ